MSSAAGFAAFINGKVYRAKGSNWISYVRNMSFQRENLKEIHPNQKYKYKNSNLVVRISREGTNWRAHVGVNDETATFLTFVFDSKNKEITYQHVDFRETAGLNGILSLSKKQKEEVIEELKGKIRDELLLDLCREQEIKKEKRLEVLEILTQEKTKKGLAILSHKREKRYPGFLMTMNSRIEPKLDEWDEFELEGNQRCTYRIEGDIESFSFYRSTKRLYRIERNKETYEMVECDIEPYFFGTIEEPHVFVLEQEELWSRMKQWLQEEEEKQKKIEALFSQTPSTREMAPEHKQENESLVTEWTTFQQTVITIRNQLLQHVEELGEENRWYVIHILPKRMDELQNLYKEDMTVENQQYFASCTANILTVLHAIQKDVSSHQTTQLKIVERLTNHDIKS